MKSAAPRILSLTLIFLLFFSLSARYSTPVRADNKVFTAIGTNDLFSNPARWSGGTLPGAGSNLTIFGNCIFDNAASNLAYGVLTFGSGPPDPAAGGIIWPAGGANTLRVSSISVPNKAAATIDMTAGGTLQIGGSWDASDTTFIPGAGTIVISGSMSLPAQITHYHNLTINPGTSTVSLNNSIQVGGALSVSSGTLQLGTEGQVTVNLAGNLLNNGTLIAGSSTVSLSGSLPQNLGGTGALNFYNLTLNNSSGISLSRDIQISHNLSFSNGLLTTAANKVVLAAGASLSGAGPAKYVAGSLQKHVAAGSGAYYFEIGTPAGYAPLNLNFSNASSGDILASVALGDHPSLASSTIDPSHSVNLYWTLINSGVAFASCGATFNFLASDLDAGANPGDFVLAELQGSTWSYPGISSRAATSLQASVMSFGDFAIGANQVDYTLDVAPPAHGTVSKNPDQASYAPGTVVQLSATPDPGYAFGNWGGDLSGSANPASITLNGNKNVSATFVQSPTLQLNLTTVGSGAVAKYPDRPAYNPGDQVTLTANPAAGWSFSAWSGDLSGSSNPVTITLNSGLDITAAFSQLSYQLNVTAAGSGTVSKNPDLSSYHYGDQVTLTANPAPGWSFTGWSGDLTGNANPASITLSANNDVTATFSQGQFSIAASAGAGGSISPAGNVLLSGGVNQTFTLQANQGYSLSSLSVDGSPINPPPGSYTFSNVTANHTIAAAFSRNQYALTLNVVGSGSINPNNDGPYYYGDTVQLTPLPASGWAFSAWSGALSGSASPANLTISADSSVTATFVVSSGGGSSGGGGSGGGAGSGGGGGGGGGISAGGSIPTPTPTPTATPSAAPVPAGYLDISPYLDSTGSLTSQFLTSSGDGKVALSIPRGTKVTVPNAAVVDHLTVLPAGLDDKPAPPRSKLLGEPYSFGPEGSTFDPPITLTFNYDPSLITPDLDPATLALAYWDNQKNAWTALAGSRVDQANHRVSAAVSHFSVYGLVASLETTPAAFSVLAFSLTPPQVQVGESVSIYLKVANVGGSGGSCQADISLNGQTVRTLKLDIAAQSSQELNFAFVPAAPGDYQVSIDGQAENQSLSVTAPADGVVVSNAQLGAAPVIAGQAFTVSARLVNHGADQSAYPVVLKIDGQSVATQALNLPGGGAGQKVTFSALSRSGGEHTLEINGVQLQFSVDVPAADFVVGQISLTPERVKAGDQVSVQADLTNDLDYEARSTVRLTLDGELLQSPELTLAGGEQQQVSFEATAYTPGEHTVSINNVSARFTVMPAEKAASPLPWWLIAAAFAAVAFLVSLWVSYGRLSAARRHS